MESQWELINVEEALRALKTAQCGRPLNEARIARYASDMVNKRWRSTPQGPVYDEKGILRDGQNRYAAIIKAAENLEKKGDIKDAFDFGLRMWVTRNWDGDQAAFDVMDTGDKRAYTDLLFMRGHANVTQLRAILRRITRWEAGQPWTRNTTSTHSELDETLAAHPEAADAAKYATAWHAPVVAQSLAGFAWWLLSPLGEDDCAFFMEALRTGTGYESSPAAPHPVHVLRERLLRDQRNNQMRGTFTRTEVTIWMIIRAWNAYRNGEVIKKIQLPEEITDDTFIKPV